VTVDIAPRRDIGAVGEYRPSQRASRIVRRPLTVARATLQRWQVWIERKLRANQRHRAPDVLAELEGRLLVDLIAATERGSSLYRSVIYELSAAPVMHMGPGAGLRNALRPRHVRTTLIEWAAA